MSDINAMSNKKFKFYEFFAGGGMARAGLGEKWECCFANDIDRVKALTYKKNWGPEHFDDRDVREVKVRDLKRSVDLAWASFPCQDLSIAGNGLGIGTSNSDAVTRSGAVWPFLDLMCELVIESRQPPLIVLENVLGLITLEGGKDFSTICTQLLDMGYRCGAVILDAKYFLPQSRPRVFIIAINGNIRLPKNLTTQIPLENWHPPILFRAYKALPKAVQEQWVWWDLGIAPILPKNALDEVIDFNDAHWHAPEETKRIVSMMAPSHMERLIEAKSSNSNKIGSLYFRMRREKGINKQRAEISFSDVLGCLRTPRGGASRPRIIVAGAGEVRTRMLSIPEASALMGLSPEYVLPDVYQHAFKILGDGVAVPSVRFLADRLLEPLVAASRDSSHFQNDNYMLSDKSISSVVYTWNQS